MDDPRCPRFFVTACYYYAPMFRAVQSSEPTRVLRLRRSFRLSVSASTPPAPSWAPGVTGVGLRPGQQARRPASAPDGHQACGFQTSAGATRPPYLRRVNAKPHLDVPPDGLGAGRHPVTGLARCVVEGGAPVAQAAARFQVSRPTATRCAQHCATGSSVAAKAETVSRPLVSVFAEGCFGAILNVRGRRRESTWTRQHLGHRRW
jgi:hypothetical protein